MGSFEETVHGRRDAESSSDESRLENVIRRDVGGCIRRDAGGNEVTERHCLFYKDII